MEPEPAPSRAGRKTIIVSGPETRLGLLTFEADNDIWAPRSPRSLKMTLYGQVAIITGTFIVVV